jgi:hemerythrin
MGLRWERSLETGITEVDSQHKELFERINSLLEAMSKGKGKDAIIGIFQFLADYIKLHFETEEKLMSRTKYPVYASHRQEHNSFTLKFNQLKNKLLLEGATSALVIESQPILIDWWYNHINVSDKKLGTFIKGIE